MSEPDSCRRRCAAVVVDEATVSSSLRAVVVDEATVVVVVGAAVVVDEATVVVVVGAAVVVDEATVSSSMRQPCRRRWRAVVDVKSTSSSTWLSWAPRSSRRSIALETEEV